MLTPVSTFRVLLVVAVFGGCSARTSTESSALAATTTRQFDLFAKSSIDVVAADNPVAEEEPAGANDLAFRALLAATNAAYSEVPSDEQEGSGKYRLFGHLAIVAQCDVTTTDDGQTLVGARVPQLANTWTAAGVEGPFQGEVDTLQTLVTPNLGGTAANYIVTYVVSGRPNAVAEPAFTAVLPRTNRSIFQVGRIRVGCAADGTPQVDFADQLVASSEFPSHRAWLDDATSTPIATAYKKQRGMGRLWSLPAIPVAGACQARTSNACGGCCTSSSACTESPALECMCGAGRQDCNGDPLDGCEAVLAADHANCGACGQACADGETCTEGHCVADGEVAAGPQPLTFGWGWGSTSLAASLGAGLYHYTATFTDMTNPAVLEHGFGCGTSFGYQRGAHPDGVEEGWVALTAPCALGISTKTLAGSWAPNSAKLSVHFEWPSCPVGFGDCDGMLVNGCEMPTAFNVDDCGACGVSCDATQTCVAGACVSSAGPMTFGPIRYKFDWGWSGTQKIVTLRPGTYHLDATLTNKQPDDHAYEHGFGCGAQSLTYARDFPGPESATFTVLDTCDFGISTKTLAGTWAPRYGDLTVTLARVHP